MSRADQFGCSSSMPTGAESPVFMCFPFYLLSIGICSKYRTLRSRSSLLCGLVLAAAANPWRRRAIFEAARRQASAATDLVGRVTEEWDVCLALLDMVRAYARLGKPRRGRRGLARCRFNDF